jgi:hypothetical protein
MMTLLLFVAPLTASTFVDWASMILSGMTGSALFPIHDAKCRMMTMSVITPFLTDTFTDALFGQLL